MFAGPARLASACRACALSFEALDGGNRLAAFLTLFLAALVALLAIRLDGALAPPFWLHLLWVPITAGAVTAVLRLIKASVAALRYRNGGRGGSVSGQA